MMLPPIVFLNIMLPLHSFDFYLNL